MASTTAIEPGAGAPSSPSSDGEGGAGGGSDKGRRALPAAAANENVVELPGRTKALRRAEREFLPAALEIIETPASPLGRTIGATLIAFFAIAVAWACLGKVDIIATAQGKVVP